MKIIVAAVLFLSGCATCSTPGTHETMSGTPERQVASTAYLFGGLAGFAGCVAGFAGVPFMVPVCLGGWAAGVGGISYLVYDDNRPSCPVKP